MFDLALYDLGATMTVTSLQAEHLGLHARQFGFDACRILSQGPRSSRGFIADR